MKKQAQKRNGCNRLWKKQSSYNYWIDKENDNNNQNYNYNKKFYFDKKKPFKNWILFFLKIIKIIIINLNKNLIKKISFKLIKSRSKICKTINK